MLSCNSINSRTNNNLVNKVSLSHYCIVCNGDEFRGDSHLIWGGSPPSLPAPRSRSALVSWPIRDTSVPLTKILIIIMLVNHGLWLWSSSPMRHGWYSVNPISPRWGGADLPLPHANVYTSKKSMGGNSDKFCIFLNVCFLLVKQLSVLSVDHWIGQKRLIFIRGDQSCLWAP